MDFGGALDRYFARQLDDYQRQIDKEWEEEIAIEEAEEEILTDAHYFDDATGENDDLRRALCEALIEQHRASRDKDPDAIKEAAYGVTEVMEKLAADYAPTVAELEKDE